MIGICKSRKSGHTDTEIDTEKEWRNWKCVDIHFLNPEDRKKAEAKDFFAVCEMCRDFSRKP